MKGNLNTPEHDVVQIQMQSTDLGPHIMHADKELDSFVCKDATTLANTLVERMTRGQPAAAD